MFAIFALIALSVVGGLWTSLSSEMRIPVIIYALALGAMAAQAISRARQLGNAVGTDSPLCGDWRLLFLVSDTVLAYGRFRWDIPLNAFWVLGTYYAAQWFFARSTESR